MDNDTKPINRSDMRLLLSEIGQQLAAQGRIAEIAIYGGSALILQFDFRESSHDVDYLPLRGSRWALKAAAASVGRKHNLPSGWFNDQIVQNKLSPRPVTLPYGDFPSENPGLRVFVASPQYIFAMKVFAMRSSLMAQDVEDIWNLWSELGLEDTDTAINLCTQFYPGRELPKRHKLILQDIAEAKSINLPFDPLMGW